MWLRRQLSKLRYWYSQAWHPDPSGFSERLGRIRCLDARLIKDEQKANPYLYEIDVVYPNVEVYIERVRWVKYTIAADFMIPNNWCQYQSRRTSLNAFFINSKGTQLDPFESLVSFQTEAIEFMHRHHELSASEGENAEHNQRVLDKFSRHLQQLFSTLIDYTHHDQSQ